MFNRWDPQYDSDSNSKIKPQQYHRQAQILAKSNFTEPDCELRTKIKFRQVHCIHYTRVNDTVVYPWIYDDISSAVSNSAGLKKVPLNNVGEIVR